MTAGPPFADVLPSVAEPLAFAAVGVLGSAHCLGMCGPLVTLYADRMESDGPTWRASRRMLCFNLGRTAGYVAAGALFGALGALVVDAGGLLEAATLVRAVVGIGVGLVVVAAGVGYLRGGSAGDAVPGASGLFAAVSGRLAGRVERWVRGPRIALLGTVHAALPCPLLYPAYLYALATASPARGAVALGALGLATVPAMFAYGVAFDALDAGRRATVHRALGAVFLVLGTVPLAKGLTLLGVPVPHLPLPMPNL